ncbi:MAG: LysR substrate-binding domain-containing protein [Roseicyclus sp.]
MSRPYRNLPLNPLRAFGVAARHRTFTAAADELGVSQVAVSRQISTLENYLGVKLFDRGSHSAKLSDVGRGFGHEVGEIFERMERAVRKLETAEDEATIRLRLYPTIAHYWLLPHLGAFNRRHPDYHVHLDSRIEPLDFRSTRLDLAIQLGHGTWREARSRVLFDEVVDVVCSPDYAARHNHFATPDDLAGAELIHARYRRRGWEHWSAAAGVDISAHDGTAFDTSLLVYAAALRGLGLAVGQIDLLQDDIAAGRFVRPFARPVATGARFYVVWPATRSVAPNTRAMIDWLLEVCGQPPEFGPDMPAAVAHPDPA